MFILQSWKWAAGLLALAAAVSLLPLATAARAAHPAGSPANDFASGSVLVKFKPLIPSSLADAALSVQGLTTMSTVYGSEVRKVAVTPGQEIQTVAGLMSNPLVEYAEPDYLLQSMWAPNDTYYASDQWNLRQINMEAAWDITRGSSNVKVAVVDTGLNPDNPDRPVNIVSQWNQCIGGPALSDADGHGTHVSGIIAANTNNGIGVAGVAPGVSLMPVGVECDGNISVSNAAAGVRYAADNGANVMNISLGTQEQSQTLQDAIDYAIGKGVLVVASAGNGYASGNPIMYPAGFPGVLAVGASTHDLTRASYSEVQPYVSVVAPGGDASGAADSDSYHWIKSTYSTSYASMAGTSQAAPHVAGLAGLILSINPGLTSAQVMSIITSTATDLGPPGRDDEYGWGQIDAYAALVKTQSMPPAPSPTPIGTPVATPTPAQTATPNPMPTPTPIISNVPFRIFVPQVTKNGSGW